jgi:SAM-dependent methyltransferase
VVCSLALTHVPDLAPVFAEFARVVRPGGTVIVSDIHPLYVTFGGAAAVFPTATDGFELHFVRNNVHPVGAYVRAAVDAGLVIRECHEPVVPEAAITANPAHAVVPDAVRGALDGLPYLLVWRLASPSR